MMTRYNARGSNYRYDSAAGLALLFLATVFSLSKIGTLISYLAHNGETVRPGSPESVLESS